MASATAVYPARCMVLGHAESSVLEEDLDGFSLRCWGYLCLRPCRALRDIMNGVALAAAAFIVKCGGVVFCVLKCFSMIDSININGLVGSNSCVVS